MEVHELLGGNTIMYGVLSLADLKPHAQECHHECVLALINTRERVDLIAQWHATY